MNRSAVKKDVEEGANLIDIFLGSSDESYSPLCTIKVVMKKDGSAKVNYGFRERVPDIRALKQELKAFFSMLGYSVIRVSHNDGMHLIHANVITLVMAKKDR